MSQRDPELRSQYQRLAELNATAAAAAGLPIRRVRLAIDPKGGRRGGASVHPRVPVIGRRYVLSYPLADLRAESDQAVLGSLGHEHQHIAARDLGGWPGVFMAVRIGLAALILLTAAASPGLALPFVLFGPLSPVPAVVLVLIAAAVYFVVLVRPLPTWFPHTRRSAERNQRVELRCDLVAVRTVGRDQILAMLYDLQELETASKVGTQSTRTMRWIHSRSPETHPPTSVRIGAVLGYDASTDPVVAAEKVLEVVPALSGLS